MYLVIAILISTFGATLPLHVRDVFGWGSMQSGLLFVARRPTFIGLLFLTPLLWLLGVPGDHRFPSANEDDRGRILYSVTMVLVGSTLLLLNGAGTIEATSKFFR